MTASSVRIEKATKKKLDLLRSYPKESYDSIIHRLADFRIDEAPPTEQDRKEIDEALKEIREGHYYTHDQVKKKLGLP